jgi:NitT/TauT family transport system substrate-binding protein
MRPLPVYLAFLASLYLASPAAAQEVILQEYGDVHMESAAGWVAVEKGFYGKLRVKQVQGEPAISPVQQVHAAGKSGSIAFGIDYPENIIRAREKERMDLVALSVDFQSSAIRIISWKPIISAKDIKGGISVWTGLDARPKCAIGRAWEKQLTIQNQGSDLRGWLEGSRPFASAMTYYELITVQREVKKMGKIFYTVDYRDLGIDWMDRVLFTTGEIVKKHPEVIQSVVTGRYKAFQWALENPGETFEILKRVNEDLDFLRETDAVSPVKALMVTPDTKKQGFGYILPKKWENVARNMFKAGLLDQMPDVKKVYTEKFPSGIMPK